MKAILEWLDRRTGIVRICRICLFDPIPGGVKWRYAWSTMLAFAFFMQLVTGFFLLAHYSASTQTAWESVYYFQHHVSGGWLVRALHVVTAQAFVTLLALHLMQVVIYRAYTAPRDLNFLLLLGLLPLVIGLSTTGWLLPLDQKGYWAARVPLNILSITPVVGPGLREVLLGGSEFSHLTLTRFAALHTTVLPLLTGLTLALYLYFNHRHRLDPNPGAVGAVQDAAETPSTGPAYWPNQAFRDALACLAVLAAVLVVVFLPWFMGRGEPGAELFAPADLAEPYAAARPEWFMLWLYQFLKFFAGGTEVWGAVVIPSAVLGFMAIMPWIGKWRLGHAFNVLFFVALAGGVVVLTVMALRADRANPEYQNALDKARVTAARALELADQPSGIPLSGALTLLHQDPITQGPGLFASNCASCHRYDGHDGLQRQPEGEPTAPDLAGFASREWISGLLDPEHIAGLTYFGGTRFKKGKMVRYVTREVADFSPELQGQLKKVIAAVSAEASLPSQKARDTRDAVLIEEGRELARTDDLRCIDCHQFREPDEDATAPDLTGYGSRAWMIDFVSDPAHERFYGSKNDRMPRFGPDEVLDEERIGLIVDWLRGSWYVGPESEVGVAESGE